MRFLCFTAFLWSASLVSLNMFSASTAGAGDNWPEFRGPGGDGRSDSVGLPTTWSESEHIRWKTAIHGKAWSQPVIWGKQVWLTTAPADGKSMWAVCVDKESGKITRDIKIFDISEPQFCHEFNSYASSTPAIEAGRIYCHFGTHGTACLDTGTGEVLWRREDLHCNHFRGAGSSPILFENLLIVNFDGYDVQFVVALDKKTGQTVWKKDRNIDYGIHNNDGDQKKGYGTPSVFDINGQMQLISPSAGATIAYNPLTGEEIWRVNSGGMNAAARPIYGHGLVFANSAAGGFKEFALRPNGHGDVTATHVAWKFGNAMPSRPSPILDGDDLYLIDDKGVASCLEASTGKLRWSKRIGGDYSASPVYADGKIYFCSQDGDMPVLKVDPDKCDVIAKNHLDGAFMASPAISGKALFARTKTHLYRIEN
ncbi:MAG TPA: PQQ-binding-like beta-propeller repeat protein [Pirellulales bacterium]|jgi:outer membrane protein assembly factor BamB|nr:PQQ-binding-like beta-propeller repeat protein [Pirellulales bacterium]